MQLPSVVDSAAADLSWSICWRVRSMEDNLLV